MKSSISGTVSNSLKESQSLTAGDKEWLKKMKRKLVKAFQEAVKKSPAAKDMPPLYLKLLGRDPEPEGHHPDADEDPELTAADNAFPFMDDPEEEWTGLVPYFGRPKPPEPCRENCVVCNYDSEVLLDFN